jgi:hypothetical protein
MIAPVILAVIASEAKQSSGSANAEAANWIASSLVFLAMTNVVGAT